MVFRAFIAVDLDRQERVESYITALRNVESTLKIVDPGQIHVTLKFLGQTDEDKIPRIAEAMRAAVIGVPPFDLRLRDTSAYPSKNRIRVIWVGMDNVLPLATIAGRLDESLAEIGFARESRPFAPHLTVARTKYDGPNAVVRQVITDHAGEDFGLQRVTSIRLKRSVLTRCGPQYSTVEEVLLPTE